MRVLMAVPKYPYPVVGGLERQAHELATALVGRGHVVSALSSRFDMVQKALEIVDGVQVSRVQWIDSRFWRLLVLPWVLGLKLLALLRNMDIVHIHNISWFGAFLTVLCSLLRLPVITKLPNIGDCGIVGMRNGLWGCIRVGLLKWSDVIIAMTPESLRELDDIGYPASRVLKVTNGISSPTECTRDIASGGGRALNVVFVGRLSPEKGLLCLLRAWALVKSGATRPAVLRLVGEGEQLAELRTLAAALGIGDTVEFRGYSDDVPGELAAACVFVLPSFAEGNSNAILEAMRAGLPIVATRVGGAPIQVGPEGDPFLVPPGNDRELADRLLQLIEDEALRRYLGAAMRIRVERLFAIESVAAIYERAYDLMRSGRREEIGQINCDLFNQPNKTGDTPCAQ